MPAKQEKKGNGAGKFFLGAAIGAALGAIASKFIDISVSKDDGEEVDPPKPKNVEKKPEKKIAAKSAAKPVAKSAEKKPNEKK